VIDGHWFRCIGRIEPFRGKDYGIIGHNTMRAGLNAKTTHSAFSPQNFVTSDEKRILRIPGSASFLASYPMEPVPGFTVVDFTQCRSALPTEDFNLSPGLMEKSGDRNPT